MRLDHLLSKELFSRHRRAEGRHHRRMSGDWFAHGWNVDYSALTVCQIPSTALRRVEPGRVDQWVPGTLLGPEGTAVMVCLRNRRPQ